MKCKKPFLRSGQAFGCGQCLPCRIKNRREWSHRIMLEACLYKRSCFATLTYADAPADGVQLEDYQNFLKRWRQALRPFRLRFYGVAEYGGQSGRPHYHFIFFGIPANRITEQALSEVWSLGHIDIRPLTPMRAKYIAGYVIDKLNDPNDERLCGLNPEFSTKSLKPGLGAGMVSEIGDTIIKYDLLSAEGDVPVTLTHGTTQLPLGRYLRNQVRLYLSGRLPEFRNTPSKHVLKKARILREVRAAFPTIQDQKRIEEMRHVHAVARADKENPSPLYHLLKLSAQEIRNTEARFKNFTKRMQQI